MQQNLRVMGPDAQSPFHSKGEVLSSRHHSQPGAQTAPGTPDFRTSQGRTPLQYLGIPAPVSVFEPLAWEGETNSSRYFFL